MSFKTIGPKTRPERVRPPQEPPVSNGTRADDQFSRRSSTSSIASFASAVENHGPQTAATGVKFSPEEEAELLKQSHALKSQANAQFGKKDYSSALSTYDRALAECPNYLDYELAVLQSNVAACHIQLQEWKDAIEAAEKGLDNLEKELPMPKSKTEGTESKSDVNNGTTSLNTDDQVVELPSTNDDAADAAALHQLTISDTRRTDIQRIRTKLLLRRARAKVSITESPTTASPADDLSTRPATSFSPGSTWSHLSTALSDYQTLSQPPYFASLPLADQKTVINALRILPTKVEAAKKKEVDEMMGKLKELGNGFLKPFGLSTDMFQMKKDEGSGGWSMNFDGKAGGGGKK